MRRFNECVQELRRLRKLPAEVERDARIWTSRCKTRIERFFSSGTSSTSDSENVADNAKEIVMTLHLESLDARTRDLMLEQVDSDVRDGCLYMSPRLSPTGVHGYLTALREAISHGTYQTLAAVLTRGGLLKWRELHHAKNGRPFVRAVPRDAPTLLAEGEFNRFYIRALRVRAEQNGVEGLQICRANEAGIEARYRSGGA